MNITGAKMNIAIHKGKPYKPLCFGKTGSGGRNNTGRITAPHRGGFAKRLLRIIDFKRTEFWNIPGSVVRIERDPGRTAHIALVKYTKDGSDFYRYIIAPDGIKTGCAIIAGDLVDTNIGNTMRLSEMPQGSLVHNIELHAGRGGQIAKSAGSYGRITGRDGDFIIIKMRSGELRKFRKECLATLGEVSNKAHSTQIIGSAGRNRWLGVRPSTRGIAKNPVDHAMGGRTNGGKHPCTWDGKPTRGKKTRSRRKLSNRLIITRRNNG